MGSVIPLLCTWRSEVDARETRGSCRDYGSWRHNGERKSMDSPTEYSNRDGDTDHHSVIDVKWERAASSVRKRLVSGTSERVSALYILREKTT